MPFTQGFIDNVELEVHFSYHGTTVGATTQDEYLLLADSFLGGPLRPSTYQCVRSGKNDLIRYDLETDEYGVLSRDGYIRSYYIADPEIHDFPTNFDYFEWDCQRKK